MILDDPHTVGPGTVSAILAVASLEQEDTISTEAPLMDVTLGLVPKLDLILVGSPSHAILNTEALPIEGNLQVALKWQFVRSDQWNASFSPAVDFNFKDKGQKSVLLPVQLEYSWDRFQLGSDGGYLVGIGHEDQWLAGTYLNFALRRDLRVLGEVWALGYLESHGTDLGMSGGLEWTTPQGLLVLASASTDIASFGIGRITWRAYFGIQWNFRLWGSDLGSPVSNLHRKNRIPWQGGAPHQSRRAER